MLINFTVNHNKVSEAIEASYEPSRCSAYQAQTNSTHLRCEQGVCGACTLVDRWPPSPCLYYVGCRMRNAEITTIEGLEDDEITKDIREAFME